MKKILTLILVGLTLLSCSSRKYLLSDKDSENKRLIELVEKLKKEDKINKNPVVVIDDKVVEKGELKNLNIFNSDIIKISVIEKNNTEMTQIYGEKSINGVILIETKPFQEKSTKSISDSKILFLVDGKTKTQEEIDKIDHNKIESITVIKDKKEIEKYTTDKYDGVVKIEMKKE